jgi:uncharacterized membrane protein YdjX (TVP38/TMEM64 family)
MLAHRFEEPALRTRRPWTPMNRLRAFLPLLALFAIGVALYASGMLDRFDPHNLVQDEALLRSGLAHHPWLGPFVLVGVLALVIATGVPGGILVVFAGGMLFGTVLGTILSTIGALIGATALYYASRIAFDSGTRAAPALAGRLRAGYLAHPFSYTLLLRLVPFFPFGAVSVALAWLRCPLWIFLSASALGGSVMIAFESALGAGLIESIAREGRVSVDVFAHRSVYLPLLGMALVALLPILAGRLRGKTGS